MVRAVLFMNAKTWKQPKRPSGGEWINRDISRQWGVTQYSKEMTYQAMKMGEELQCI